MNKRPWLAFGFAATFAAAGYFGCSAHKATHSTGATGSGGDSLTVGSGGGLSVGNGTGGFESCAKFSAKADVAPAAMLIVLDASASMTTANKWGTAQIAIATAIDKDGFDSMSLGLLKFPIGTVGGPQCVFGLPVTCGYSALPQVALKLAGMQKSADGMGVRSQIYNYLVNNGPVSSQDDGSPVYDSLVGAYGALKAYPNVDKRMVVLITDGGFSCTSLSSPLRPNYADLNGCPDWERPDNVNALIKQKLAEGTNTFIVGVPGTNTNGGKTGIYDNPPYSMLLALSTYAVSGSPDTIPADCDKAAVYSQGGKLNGKPCHIDLSGGNFDPNVLADAIAKIRGAAVGCVYPLPKAPDGKEIDPNQVNVQVYIDKDPPVDVLKRTDPNDTCAMDGCWDYNAKKQVVLIGKTCDAVNKAQKVDVEIYVGCASKIK